MRGKFLKIISFIALLLASGLTWNTALAGSTEDVIQQIQAEYDAGHMDATTRDDLLTNLTRAQSQELGSDVYADLIAAFRLMLAAYMDARVDPAAATRIFEGAATL